jgi:hypothetical protein
MHDNIYEPIKAKPAYNLVRRELVTGLRYMVLKTPGSNKYAQGKNHQKKTSKRETNFLPEDPGLSASAAGLTPCSVTPQTQRRVKI